jgi:hypothetical protein
MRRNHDDGCMSFASLGGDLREVEDKGLRSMIAAA